MPWNKKGQRVMLLGTEQIRPNPHQPRRHFDESALRELSESIACSGLLQPLCVRRSDEGWVLIAGERRLRAAKLAGLKEVPCLAVKAGEEEGAMLALVENIQRRDLHFLEQAQAIDTLIRRWGLTQGEAARRLGKSQGAVANKLRLLQLSPACRHIITQGGLSERHGRCALRLEEEEARLAALKMMAERGWSVQRSEEYVARRLSSAGRPEAKGRRAYIIKDVRLFLNSLDRSVQLMRRGGVAAELRREEKEEETVLTIRIPKKREKKVSSNCN